MCQGPEDEACRIQSAYIFNSAYDIQRLYDKDPLGNVLVDKKKLEKTLLLSYVCNTKAEYQRGFHEMVMLFQLMVGHEHETFWLFQFFLQKTEHSCVINIGVGKNLDMLNSLITLLDPEFAEHLSEWSAVTTTSHTCRATVQQPHAAQSKCLHGTLNCNRLSAVPTWHPCPSASQVSLHGAFSGLGLNLAHRKEDPGSRLVPVLIILTFVEELQITPE
ncbi:hypothetical protein STEG23_033320, partial [Scotinomys teguina]